MRRRNMKKNKNKSKDKDNKKVTVEEKKKEEELVVDVGLTDIEMKLASKFQVDRFEELGLQHQYLTIQIDDMCLLLGNSIEDESKSSNNTNTYLVECLNRLINVEEGNTENIALIIQHLCYSRLALSKFIYNTFIDEILEVEDDEVDDEVECYVHLINSMFCIYDS